MNASNPNHCAVLSNSGPTNSSGASPPPVVTDNTIITAMITPIKLSPTIRPEHRGDWIALHRSQQAHRHAF